MLKNFLMFSKRVRHRNYLYKQVRIAMLLDEFEARVHVGPVRYKHKIAEEVATDLWAAEMAIPASVASPNQVQKSLGELNKKRTSQAVPLTPYGLLEIKEVILGTEVITQLSIEPVPTIAPTFHLFV